MASAYFTQAFDYIKRFWAGISVSQRMFVAILAGLMVLMFIGLVVWLSRPDYGILYSNLGAEDANRVIKALEAQNIEYKLEDNGSAIKVPADKVYSLRINIAGENILTGQGIGFESFDATPFGSTDFVQKVNYQRALQGELTRTIQEFPAVENARVHLVIPRRTLFIEEQMKPSAAIAIKLASGHKMEQKDVLAIVNLVTMAVEGLDKSRVSITDTSGKVLYQPEEEGSLVGLTQTQLEHKTQIQQNIERRIQELLFPVVGQGGLIAKVNVEVDFDQKTIHRKIYDPEKSVLLSETRRESNTQGTAAIEGGSPDPNFRGDGPSGTASTQNASSEDRLSNYDYNKEEQNIIGSVGGIDRLTVAVIVDGTYSKDAEGNSVYTPRSEEELRNIRQLVANAVGYDSARGDTIEVSNMAFSDTEVEMPEPFASVIADYALRFAKPLLNALLLFLFLMFVVRPVVLALIRPKVEGAVLEGLEGLPQSEERLALIEADDETLAATAILDKIEDIKIHALQLSEQNMDQAVGIIKSWLKEGSETKEIARAA